MEFHAHRTGSGRLSQIVIDINENDDPHGDINGLLRSNDNSGDRIGAFLRLYADPLGPLTSETESDLWKTVSRASFITEVARRRLEYSWLVLRDMYGWPWRQIASAADADEEERKHATIRRHVIELRRSISNLGVYFDSEGRHGPDFSEPSSPTPEERAIAQSIAAYRERSTRSEKVTFMYGWTRQDGDESRIDTPDFVTATWHSDPPVSEHFEITY